MGRPFVYRGSAFRRRSATGLAAEALLSTLVRLDADVAETISVRSASATMKTDIIGEIGMMMTFGDRDVTKMIGDGSMTGLCDDHRQTPGIGGRSMTGAGSTMRVLEGMVVIKACFLDSSIIMPYFVES
jgi:hypothetical protein